MSTLGQDFVEELDRLTELENQIVLKHCEKMIKIEQDHANQVAKVEDEFISIITTPAEEFDQEAPRFQQSSKDV